MIAARIGSVALMTVTLLIVGCGSNTATTSTSTSPTPTPTPVQSQRTLMFTLAACIAECDPMSEGASKFGQGTVRVDIKNYGYTLTVTVTGMTPSTQHLINFHIGSCATPDLDAWVQVDVAAADATGTLTSVTTSPVAWIVPEKGRILTVHGDEPKRRQTHIACTNLTN